MPLSKELSKKIDVLARQIVRQFVEKLKPAMEAEARRICIEAARTALAAPPVANAVAPAESPLAPANTPTTRDRILEALRDGQPHSQRAVQNAVAQLANVKSNSVAKGIARLIAAGEVVSSENGVIKLSRK